MIRELLIHRRLSEALAQLTPLAMQQHRGEHLDVLNEIAESYALLRTYMQDGVDDAQRNQLFENLLLRAYALADTLDDANELQRSSTQYYARRRLIDMHGGTAYRTLLAEVDQELDKLALSQLLDNADTLELRRRLEAKTSDLFVELWATRRFNAEDTTTLIEWLQPQRLPQHIACLLITAITLGAQQQYDQEKLRLLLSLCTHTQQELRQRALVGVVLLISCYHYRLSPTVTKIFALLAEEPTFVKELTAVYLQLIRCKDTERVTKHLTEDIFPEISKVTPELYRSMSADMNDAEENPEWDKVLSDASITTKIHELNELQSEGADVFMVTFAHLKHFSFFQELANWFLPFCVDNTHVVKALGRQVTSSAFVTALTSTPTMCNSDKYSLSLSLAAMPEQQRSLLEQQFGGESIELDKQTQEEALLSQQGDGASVVKSYMQDLYRFYKLYRCRGEMPDPFALGEELHRIPLLSPLLLHQASACNVVAEFYFSKGYYALANELYTLMADTACGDKAFVYQKRGYCLQKLNKTHQALENYLLANDYLPDSLWTLRRIAACYRLLHKEAEAIDYLQRAARVQPENAPVELQLGHCYAEQGNYRQACQHYFKVLFINEKEVRAMRGLAWCSLMLNDTVQGKQYIDKVLSLSPSGNDFINAGHIAFVQRQFTTAAHYYLRAMEQGGMTRDTFVATYGKDAISLQTVGVTTVDIAIMLDKVLF